MARERSLEGEPLAEWTNKDLTTATRSLAKRMRDTLLRGRADEEARLARAKADEHAAMRERFAKFHGVDTPKPERAQRLDFDSSSEITLPGFGD